MIQIFVDNRARLHVPASLEIQLEREFTYENPNYEKAGKLTGEPATIETWDVSGDYLTFPRGGLYKVREVLGRNNAPFTVHDQRVWCHPETSIPGHKFTLRDYQLELIDAAEKKQNCLLKAPTGSGKTTAAFGLISRLKRRALVMVWTGNLLEQWRERCGTELGIHGDDVGIIRGGEFRIRPVTLAMQQSIVERFKDGNDELADMFDVIVCDEVQRFAAPTLFATVDPFKARYRIGISADHTRKDGKEFLTHDLFGHVACAVDESRLVKDGSIVEVEVMVVPTDFRAPWYRFRQDWNKLLGQITSNEARNTLALQLAEKVVREQGQQVLMFTHRVEHARKLDARLVERGIQSGVMLGGAQEELVFDRTKQGLRDGSHRAGVGTYQAIAQGLDLPSVSCGICVTPVANNRQQFGQVKGRLCRAASGKDSGKLYYLLDQDVYGKKPVRNFLEWGCSVKVWDGTNWISGKDYLRTR